MLKNMLLAVDVLLAAAARRVSYTRAACLLDHSRVQIRRIGSADSPLRP